MYSSSPYSAFSLNTNFNWFTSGEGPAKHHWLFHFSSLRPPALGRCLLVQAGQHTSLFVSTLSLTSLILVLFHVLYLQKPNKIIEIVLTSKPYKADSQKPSQQISRNSPFKILVNYSTHPRLLEDCTLSVCCCFLLKTYHTILQYSPIVRSIKKFRR